MFRADVFRADVSRVASHGEGEGWSERSEHRWARHTGETWTGENEGEGGVGGAENKRDRDLS